MAKEHARLKLGKRASFVKTHLKQLPQEKEAWEVDFRALPRPADQADTHYLGLAVALPKAILWSTCRWNTPRPSTTWRTFWPMRCAGFPGARHPDDWETPDLTEQERADEDTLAALDMTKRMAMFGIERSGQAFVEFFEQQLDVFG